MYSVFYLLAVAVTLVLLYAFNDERKNLLVVIISVIFGVLCFHMHVNSGKYIDTIRFYKTLDEIRNVSYHSGELYSLKYLLTNTEYSAVPLSGIYIWLISLMKNNAWLNFWTGFIIVFCTLKSILLAYKKNNNSTKALFLTSLFYFSVFNLFSAVAGVRQNISFSIFTLLVYNFCSLKKLTRKDVLKVFIYCILLSLFHSSMIIYSIIFIGVLILKTEFGLWGLNFILLSSSFYQVPLQNMLASINIPIFQSLAFKGSQYFGDNAYINAISAFSDFRNMLRLAMLSLVCFLKKINFINKDKYFYFLVSLYFLAIGSVRESILFGRTSLLILYISLPIMVEFLSLDRFIVKNKMLIFLLEVSIVVLLFYSGISLVDNMRAATTFVHLK